MKLFFIYTIAGGSPSVNEPTPAGDRTLFSCCFDYYTGCLASLKGTERYIYFSGSKPEELYALSLLGGEEHR